MADIIQTKAWKKVYQGDIPYVVNEFKDVIERPAVIIVNGELGAGKTTFIKEFRPEENATSPTYSVVQEMGNTAHADFYRLKSSDDIDDLDLDAYGEDKEYFFIEWGANYFNKIKRALGFDFNYYSLEILINAGPSDQSLKTPSRNYILSEYKIHSGQ